MIKSEKSVKISNPKKQLKQIVPEGGEIELLTPEKLDGIQGGFDISCGHRQISCKPN
jgi:hypothetical protein